MIDLCFKMSLANGWTMFWRANNGNRETSQKAVAVGQLEKDDDQIKVNTIGENWWTPGTFQGQV